MIVLFQLVVLTPEMLVLFSIVLMRFPEAVTAELILGFLSLVINALLTAAIFWVNYRLSKIEAENHRPQIEVNRYRFYDEEDKKEFFEVELSNFGSGSVDNIRGVAQAFPDDSEESMSEPVEIALERTKAVESDWNATRARGMAGHEENIGFICEVGLRFPDLEEDADYNIIPLEQAISILADEADDIRLKYELRYDCKFCETDDPSEEVLDIIFPAKDNWDLEKALDEGWDYQKYLADKNGYRAATV